MCVCDSFLPIPSDLPLTFVQLLNLAYWVVGKEMGQLMVVFEGSVY